MKNRQEADRIRVKGCYNFNSGRVHVTVNFACYASLSCGISALAMKKVLLMSVDPNSSLKNVTTSGGRLNVGKAAKELLKVR